MITLDLLLKIYITAFFGYITLNTFLRFHFSMDRIAALFMVLLFVASIFYLDTTLTFEFTVTGGILLFLCLILKGISMKKQRHGFLFFNTYKNQYEDIKKEIDDLAFEFNIKRTKFNYNKRKPWLVIIKDVKLKQANEFMKKLDNINTHKPKKITMYNYWFVIGFFTIMVMLWRF